MSVLVVLSLFISLCTVTLLVWLRRLLNRLGLRTLSQQWTQQGRHGQNRDQAHGRRHGQVGCRLYKAELGLILVCGYVAGSHSGGWTRGQKSGQARGRSLVHYSYYR